MIRTSIKLLLATTLLQFCSAAYAQNTSVSTTKPNSDSLNSDFNLFRSQLVSTHPSLYFYESKVSLTSFLDSCSSAISEHTTINDFFLLLKSVCAKIKDGHLNCKQPDDLQKYDKDRALLFPLQVYFDKGRCFIRASEDKEVPSGAEIISINQISIGEIKQKLFHYISSDGFNTTKKEQVLNRYFGLYFKSVYGEFSHFEIGYRLNNGTIKSLKLKGCWFNKITRTDEPQEQNLLNLQLKREIAILKILSFDPSQLTEKKLDFIRFLDSSFTEIKKNKISDLIIDLRDNGGGRDLYGSLLYSYIAKRSFVYYQSLCSKTSDLPYENLSFSNSSYNDLNKKMLRPIKGGYKLKKTAHANLNRIKPNKNSYKGNIWILINGQTFSTASEFCAIAKSHQRGLFIGEETGGAYLMNTSGPNVSITLPHSKIRLKWGAIQYIMKVKKRRNRESGIAPHFFIKASISDILTQEDKELDFTLRLIAEKR
jgi:hypothetical protein